LGVDLFEVVVGKDDVLALFVFVAFDDLVPRHGLVVDGTDPLVANAALVLGMEHVEGQVVPADGREKFDGNGNEPEIDRSGPDRVCQGTCPLWISAQSIIPGRAAESDPPPGRLAKGLAS